MSMHLWEKLITVFIIDRGISYALKEYPGVTVEKNFRKFSLKKLSTLQVLNFLIL